MRILRMKAGAGHSALYVFILHELLPDKTRAMILGHEHGDSQVEAEHVRVVPVYERIEGVAIAVLGPHFAAILAAYVAQHANAVVEKKRKRATGGAWNDAAINGTKCAAIRGRASPCGVALHVIRCLKCIRCPDT